MHSVGPVSFTLEHEQVNKLMVLGCFLRGHLFLDELLSPLGKLEGLSHPVKFPDAVAVISSIVIMSKAVLVLS